MSSSALLLVQHIIRRLDAMLDGMLEYMYLLHDRGTWCCRDSDSAPFFLLAVLVHLSPFNAAYRKCITPPSHMHAHMEGAHRAE